MGISIPMALVMEAFVSIHMSILVLKPLSIRLSPQDPKSKFWQLFKTRALILIIGNFISTNIALIDFFAVFVGTAILTITNISNSLTPTKNNNMVINENIRITPANRAHSYEEELKILGISEPEVFKRELYSIFLKYENSITNFDYSTLGYICTNSFFKTTCGMLTSLETDQRKRIFENIELTNMSINKITTLNSTSFINVTFDISLNYYTIDSKTNLFIKGNKYSKKNKRLEIQFCRETQNIVKSSRCSGCGAPLKRGALSCEYCGVSSLMKNEWQINALNVLKEELI